MNNNSFRIFHQAPDDDLLEEAYQKPRRRHWQVWVGVAACLCLLFAGLWQRNAGPVATVESLADLGYDFVLPEDAENVKYKLVTLGKQEAAQASFSMDDTKYIYRALKCDAPQDLSGISQSAENTLFWDVCGLDFQLSQSASSSSVSWYMPDTQTQWYLSASEDTTVVLTTAREILLATGLDIAVAPADAEDVCYNVFSLENLTVAETTFTRYGIGYSFRMAYTNEVTENFTDISGLDASLERVAAGSVQWCRAKIFYTPEEQGKIIWFDVVPGILYSLSMDSHASETALSDTANALFVPAQEDAP